MTPAQVAKNAAAIRNMAARLEAWGIDDAHKRAEFLRPISIRTACLRSRPDVRIASI